MGFGSFGAGALEMGSPVATLGEAPPSSSSSVPDTVKVVAVVGGAMLIAGALAGAVGAGLGAAGAAAIAPRGEPPKYTKGAVIGGVALGGAAAAWTGYFLGGGGP